MNATLQEIFRQQPYCRSRCTVLRSRWYQCGIRTSDSYTLTVDPMVCHRALHCHSCTPQLRRPPSRELPHSRLGFWGARVFAACGAAVLTPVAAAVAAELAPPGHEGRSLSLVMGGLSVAWVFGIPLGTVVGDRYGWRASFLLVALLAALAALGVRALLPLVEVAAQGNLRSRVVAGKQPAVLVALLVTALGVAAGFVVLTYVHPLLKGLTGFTTTRIGILLLLFGLAAVAGTALGGVAADRWGYRVSMFAMLLVLPLPLLCFSLLFAARVGSFVAIAGTGAALVAWSVAGFAIIPLQQDRLVKIAADDEDAVLSLNASAIYLGQGMGSGLGSLVLAHGSLSYLGGAGALCAAAALAVLTLGNSLQRTTAASGKDEE